MTTGERDRARFNGARDPWRNSPSGELGDPLLPRWFVLTALATVVVAVVVLVLAVLTPQRQSVPVEERRPPPSQTHTTAVGDVAVGQAEAQPWDAPCPLLAGVRLAGTADDRRLLRQGLAGLCNVALPDDARAALTSFADAGGVVRFATFEATGVDSTARRDTPTVLLNARFQQTDPLWMAPLLVHDTVMRAMAPEQAETALAARRAEAAVCARLLGSATPSRGCLEANEILALEDPLATLRSAGFE